MVGGSVPRQAEYHETTPGISIANDLKVNEIGQQFDASQSLTGRYWPVILDDPWAAHAVRSLEVK